MGFLGKLGTAIGKKVADWREERAEYNKAYKEAFKEKKLRLLKEKALKDAESDVYNKGFFGNLNRELKKPENNEVKRGYE